MANSLNPDSFDYDNSSKGQAIDVIVDIPGFTKFGLEDDPAISAGQIDYAAKEVHGALEKLLSLSKKIENSDEYETCIDGKITTLNYIKLSGDFTVTHIELGYFFSGIEQTSKYSKKKFYEL